MLKSLRSWSIKLLLGNSVLLEKGLLFMDRYVGFVANIISIYICSILVYICFVLHNRARCFWDIGAHESNCCYNRHYFRINPRTSRLLMR